MIHADPGLVSFDRSFSAWERIRAHAHYTGYVVESGRSWPPTSDAGAGEVVVSAGGGAVGGPLLRAALAARALTSLAGRTWRLLVGPNLPPDEHEALRRRAGEGVVVEPARPDFAALLSNATLSISQGGYNTLIETLCLADRAVIVPFAGGLETEQTRRATLLAERGMIQVVAESALGPQTLAAAVERALAGRSIRSFPRCDTGGGPASVALLGRALQRHRAELAS